ncbi:hypothetical protein B0H66DRAFT_528786 [Apodospora peruviana]|uniref:Uncharacterized protein n=1 Tax=Apodospora peruviana TaxID=516989 RepID=A0AAE0IUF6_9PEZI|nr:hypothetical protein B0H66DRAFT_528786 [Apodospora peruviana]
MADATSPGHSPTGDIPLNIVLEPAPNAEKKEVAPATAPMIVPSNDNIASRRSATSPGAVAQYHAAHARSPQRPPKLHRSDGGSSGIANSNAGGIRSIGMSSSSFNLIRDSSISHRYSPIATRVTSDIITIRTNRKLINNGWYIPNPGNPINSSINHHHLLPKKSGTNNGSPKSSQTNPLQQDKSFFSQRPSKGHGQPKRRPQRAEDDNPHTKDPDPNHGHDNDDTTTTKKQNQQQLKRNFYHLPRCANDICTAIANTRRDLIFLRQRYVAVRPSDGLYSVAWEVGRPAPEEQSQWEQEWPHNTGRVWDWNAENVWVPARLKEVNKRLITMGITDKPNSRLRAGAVLHAWQRQYVHPQNQDTCQGEQSETELSWMAKYL